MVETDEFSTAWEGFFRATRRARGRLTGPIESTGITLAQYHLLEGLRSTPEMTVSELAMAAGVAPPTATRMLDCLVRDGLVTREPSKHDRRVVLVSLTERGAEAVHAAADAVNARRRLVRDRLTESEQEQAAALLRLLTAAVEAEQ